MLTRDQLKKNELIKYDNKHEYFILRSREYADFPFTFSAIVDDVEFMEMAFRSGVAFTSKLQFQVAVQHDSLKVLRFILSVPNNSVTNLDMIEALKDTIYRLQYHASRLILNALIAKGAIVDYTAFLRYAANAKVTPKTEETQNKIISMLQSLQPKAKPQPKDNMNDLLKSTIMRGDLAQLRLLLKHARVENYDEMIAYAEDYERYDIVKFLRREKND